MTQHLTVLLEHPSALSGTFPFREGFVPPADEKACLRLALKSPFSRRATASPKGDAF